MRRPLFIAIGLAVAAPIGAGVFWYQHRPPPPMQWQGYAEADFVKVGPTQPGLLTEVDVARGDQVAAGTLLFQQDDTPDRAADDQAERQLHQAQEQLANLQAAGKPTEIEQAQANLAEARATLERTKTDFNRGEFLFGNGTMSGADARSTAGRLPRRHGAGRGARSGARDRRGRRWGVRGRSTRSKRR